MADTRLGRLTARVTFKQIKTKTCQEKGRFTRDLCLLLATLTVGRQVHNQEKDILGQGTVLTDTYSLFKELLGHNKDAGKMNVGARGPR